MNNDQRRIQLLKDTKRLLDENHIEFFPIFGTLLGFVREGQIIPWDDDVDLGVWHYDFEKVKNLKDNFEKLGYNVTFSSGKYPHTEIFYGDRDEFHLTIEFWVKDKDKFILMKFFDDNKFNKIFSGLKETLQSNFHKSILISIYNFLSRSFNAVILHTKKRTVFSYSWFKKMKTIRVYNLDFKLPSEYEQYLELTYGKNWKTPRTDWTYEKWEKVNKSKIKYTIRDKNVRDLWIKRGDIRGE